SADAAVTSIRCWWSPGKQCRHSSVRPAVTQRSEPPVFGLKTPCVLGHHDVQRGRTVDAGSDGRLSLAASRSHCTKDSDLVWRGICLQEQERKVWHPKGGVGRVQTANPRTADLGA